MSTLKIQRAAVLLLALVISMVLGCGADPADPKSPEQVLLDKAILGLWGETSPDSVVALETRSTLTATQSDFTATFELETLLASDKCYREVRRWKDFDIREEFVQGPSKSWRLVDGTVVEMKDIEKDALPESRENWLFEISKLNCLKDTARFKLKHQGRHKNAKGLEVERLEVFDQVRAGSQLTLDFSVATWLVERVTLEADGSDDTFTLVLSDYRSIDGVQFPHQIDSLENDAPFAQQRQISYVINPSWKKESFEAPVDLNRDAINLKPSIGGLFATAPLSGPDADIPSAIAELKTWIEDNKLEVNGPLMVIRQLARAPKKTGPDLIPDRVAIAVKVPKSEIKQKIIESKTFSLMKIESQRSLCLTQVGSKPFDLIKKQIEEQGKGGQIKSTGAALEIYFSPEGTIRQFQVPVQ
ncbi:MAG: hypothetical protein ACI97A_003881 [Planctomycetota bacterium]|jgi:hypothetical protein